MEDTTYYKVYKYGKYYNPANLHYTKSGIYTTSVGCDRCLCEDITACIGWSNFDLCLECIGIIDKKFDDGTLLIYDDELSSS